ncbi:MAG: HesA/MoeB/ThiF family protein [Muribaculaceae bacterium]|nr:HesA/MoeB/ThiF family protein [Muribaculaceae bacterium]
MSRYSRQMMLAEIGETGQRRLMESSVLIVGLGGLGCPVALYLAGAGVGRIGLADADSVSETNLHRQLLYADGDVGRSKCEAARERLAAVAPHCRFELHPQGLIPENVRELIACYDLVVDCCDNYATRFMIDDVCAELGKTWVFGAISGYGGMVSVFNGLHRYDSLFPDRESLGGEPASSGAVMGPTPGVVGSVEAAEAIKILAGSKPALAGRLFTADLLTMNFQTIEL